MRVLRSRLLWLASMTLTVQVAGFAIAPAALCCLPTSPNAQAANMQCCKDAGPGHICPLMKKKTPPGATGGVSLRSCCSPEDQVFTALLGFAGVLTPAAHTLLAAPPRHANRPRDDDRCRRVARARRVSSSSRLISFMSFGPV